MFQFSQSGTQCVVETETSESHSNNPSGSGERKQPTYTTVGSIYNPDATTPIQPPTRRPRARRYQPSAQSPIESALTFQNSLLAALPVKDTTPTSPTPGANRVLQYSQLQQNCHRAANPLNVDERNTVQTGFGMSVPSIRSGNLPPPMLGLGITALEEKPDTPDTKEDEDISVVKEPFPSRHFNTATLTNLAAFPNPMQDTARNILARARSLDGGPGRADTPVSFSHMSSESVRSTVDSAFGPPSTITGAPRPLEAGPPGRRQFNSSTFQGTLKALRLGKEGQTESLHSPTVGIQSKLATNMGDNAGVADLLTNTQNDSYGGVDLASYCPHLADTMDPPFASTSSTTLPFFAATLPLGSLSDYRAGKTIHDTLPAHAIKVYYPHGLSPDYHEKYDEIPGDWIKQYPLAGNGYSHESESADERLAKINRKFYSGTEKYIKDMEQIHLDYNHRRFKNSLGVIGGERQLYQKRQEPRHLSLEEANSTDDSVHAAPLLNMAYGSLMHWKEASDYRSEIGKFDTEYGFVHGKKWGPTFSLPNHAYIDASEGGNNSFFSLADLPKKKKPFKKIRRGY